MRLSLRTNFLLRSSFGVSQNSNFFCLVPLTLRDLENRPDQRDEVCFKVIGFKSVYSFICRMLCSLSLEECYLEVVLILQINTTGQIE